MSALAVTLLIALVAIACLAYKIVDRILTHGERMKDSHPLAGITENDLERGVELLVLNAVHRTAPDESLEVLERIAASVVEDFADGVLTDPRTTAPDDA